jgi:hypothetical protein
MPKQQHAVEHTRSSPEPPTLARLETLINLKHRAVRMGFRKTTRYAADCGLLLKAAKDLVQFGGWQTWIGKHTDVSPRTARVYMQIADKFNELDDAERQTAAILSLRFFLETLTQPSEDTMDTADEEVPQEEPTNVHPIGPGEIAVLDPPVAVTSPHPKPSRLPPTLSDEELAESRQKFGWGEVMSGVRMLILAAKHHDPGDLVQNVKLEELASGHERIERAHKFLARIEAMMAEKLRSSSTLH